MSKILLQTTIPESPDDWDIKRFSLLADELRAEEYELVSDAFFDTVVIKVDDAAAVRKSAEAAAINFRYYDNNLVGISLDETTTYSDVLDILLLLDHLIYELHR